MARKGEENHKFMSEKDFEKFRIRWIRICARLNKHGRNAQILAEAEKRAKKALND